MPNIVLKMELVEISTFLKDISIEEQLTDSDLARNLHDIISHINIDMNCLKEKRLIMINSTATGGGVAEMLPRLMYLIKYFNINVVWKVLKTDITEFFTLTKKIHNFIHGENPSKLEVSFSREEKILYEKVNEDNAKELINFLQPGDIVMIHDPQPCSLIKFIRQKFKSCEVPCYWRCHIGYDRETKETKAAWNFLEEYVKMYDLTVFSTKEYVPNFAPNPRIVSPSLHPLDYKNKNLRFPEITNILKKSGIIPYKSDFMTKNEEYEHKVKIYDPFVKSFVIPSESETMSQFGFTERPIIFQISRWDALKGWSELLDAFVYIKNNLENLDLIKSEKVRKYCDRMALVMAGPDCSKVSDDPEGAIVLKNLMDKIDALPEQHKSSVALLNLPLNVRYENALMVNALQRISSIVVQNSIKEGFGLTLTEALWKQVPCIGTTACGLRAQIKDGENGLIIEDPRDYKSVANKILEMISLPEDTKEMLVKNAKMGVIDNFLIYKQMFSYLSFANELAGISCEEDI
jgi:trehalose synthase